MKRGDIVLIKAPFTDLSVNKVRPALVVSSDWHTKDGLDALFVLISSQTDNQRAPDILIDEHDPEFPKTGLKKASLIKTSKIVVLQKDLAIRTLGEAGPNLLTSVDKMLARILDLNVSEQEAQDYKAEENFSPSQNSPKE